MKKRINKAVIVKKQPIFPYFLFRIVLGIIIMFYFSLGIAAFVGGNAAISLASNVYGVSLSQDAQTLYIIKVIGALFIGLGILGVFAWADPIKNSAIVNGISILLFIRAIERIVYFNEIQSAFGLSTARIISGTVIFLLGAISLFFLRPKRQ